MNERINIHEHIASICALLGLEPDDVAEIVVQPRDVTAKVYKRDADGSKYVEDDIPAVETHTFAVIA